MKVLDSFNLKDTVSVLTGGAGLYGKAIAEALVEAGSKVVIASRNVSELQKVADEYRNKGGDITAFHLDLSDEASILQLRDDVMKKYGKVDVLVNNAVARTMKNGYKDDLAAFDESMRINATGLFCITRAFGDVMAEQKKGSIVNIGSIQGMIGPDATIYEGTSMSGWYPDYFFHKGGMINFTRFTASYYGPFGVRCNCVSPGGMFTQKTPSVFNKNYSARTFLNRMANGEDIKGVIVFLASDASVYITGSNIPVDGGYTAK